MLITFGQILEIGINRLKQAKILDAERDGESLLLYLMNESKNFIYLHRNDGTDEDRADAYFDLIDRRAAGEPLQYIVGEQEFMGLPFTVNPSVLIPRQDTETLVITAIELAKNMKSSLSILDMCCGSGAIAVSMAHFLPKSKVVACDISEDALKIAMENAKKNRVEKKVKFHHTDLYFDLNKNKQIRGKFDMILCNPPYIKADVIPTLQKEIREYEPILALSGGNDGLDIYRNMIPESSQYMKKDAYILFEIGYDQGKIVEDLLEECGTYKEIRIKKDLAGLDRVVVAKFNGK